MMKDVRVEAEEALVSFDVTSLFTNVPIDEAVDVIHRKLTEEEEEDLVEWTPLPAERIAELLQLCLKSTYFSHNGVQLKVKEALHIKKTPANNRLNRDGGYELLGCWIATMKKLGGGDNRASANCTGAPPSAPSRIGA